MYQGLVPKQSSGQWHKGCELIWLESILEDMMIKCDEPTRLYCDNKFAISIAHNPMQHDRTKHIEVDRHFIKEKLDKNLIYTPYVSSQGNHAQCRSSNEKA